MSSYINLTHRVFARLTVVSREKNNKHGQSMFLCLCSCGIKKVIAGASLVNGATRSCGCYNTEVKTKHGMYGTKIYRTWRNILNRCYNPKSIYFHRYGGRNIKVCDRWHNFLLFYHDIGIPPTNKHTVERIDNNGDYEPINCKWATMTTQNNNRGSYNHNITYNRKTMTITEWSRVFNISPQTIAKRIKNKWSIEKALTSPIMQSR